MACDKKKMFLGFTGFMGFLGAGLIVVGSLMVKSIITISKYTLNKILGGIAIAIGVISALFSAFLLVYAACAGACSKGYSVIGEEQKDERKQYTINSGTPTPSQQQQPHIENSAIMPSVIQ
jgi:uncharacterized membrane protein YphA (DoxX/SURF4 family)